jgi:hypothetical protein
VCGGVIWRTPGSSMLTFHRAVVLHGGSRGVACREGDWLGAWAEGALCLERSARWGCVWHLEVHGGAIFVILR